MPYADLEKRRARDRRRKKAVIDRVHKELGGKCAACGVEGGLEIHHKDPSQKAFNFAQRWTKRWDDLLVEIAKCELRCVEHHKEFHAAKHGTVSRYTNNGCRCDDCVSAFRVYDAAKHRRHRRERWEAADLSLTAPAGSS